MPPSQENTLIRATRRMHHCGFVGAFIGKDREAVMHSLKVLPDSCIVRAKNWSSGLHHSQREVGAPEELPLLSPRRYRDTLLETAFTIAPGGGNEETYRVYEALEAASIPIIKHSPAWAPLGTHPLPMVHAWSPEAIALHLSTTGPALDVLQREVVHWWRRFKSERAAAVGHAVLPGAGVGQAARVG